MFLYNNLPTEQRSVLLPEISENDIKRFNGKIGFTADPEKCWEWKGSKRGKGYGQFGIKNNKRAINVTVTRLAYFLHYKVDPVGLLVCHICDNPSCVNPKHLFLGTTKVNSHDRDKKGRNINPVGTHHGMSKLIEEDVRYIKKVYVKGIGAELARQFGVYQSVVSRIINNKAWNHVSKING